MHNNLCRRIRPLAAIGLLAVVSVPAVGQVEARSTMEAVEIIPVDEITPGLRGVGYSVFTGSTPERFEAEVVGLWRDVAPDTTFILARLSGQGLEESGVIAGMSGSPVYFDGRLAGAVAFSWPFAREPIAGITPIENMRAMMSASAQGVPAMLAPEGGIADVLRNGDAEARLSDALARIAGPRDRGSLGGARAGSVWVASGLSERSRDLLANSLGAVPAGIAPGGSEDSGRTSTLEAGDSVAAVLVDGDLRMAVVGTVTDRVDDSLLAFGHPFLGRGDVLLPMAVSEVVTVISNQVSSFKIANLGEIVGAFDLDRAPGIRGRLGLEAPMIPMTVALRGERDRSYAMRIAEEPSLTPVLVAVATLSSIDSTTQAAGEHGIDLVATFRLAGREPLRVVQSFDGESGAVAAAVNLLAYTNFLLGNGFEEVEIESIEVEIEQFRAPRTATLLEAHAGRTVVRPGETVPINVELTAYRGDVFRRSLELEVPTDVPDGPYSILIGDGTSVDGARLAVEEAAPVNLRQALELLRSLHSRKDLVALGVFPSPGLAVAGEALPRLPGSMRSIWSAAGSPGAKGLRLAVGQEVAVPMDRPVAGIVRVDLEVQRREPLGGAGSGRPSSDGTADGSATEGSGE